MLCNSSSLNLKALDLPSIHSPADCHQATQDYLFWLWYNYFSNVVFYIQLYFLFAPIAADPAAVTANANKCQYSCK